MSFIKIMDRRISVRSFSTEIPGEEQLAQIKRIVERKRKGPFGNNVSLRLMDAKDKNIEDMGKMTSYGVLKDARFFFGGYSTGDDRSIIDFGYCFENVLLDLTALDLGTCWMGGTFGRSFFANILSLPEGQVIPAISPVGISLDKRAVADKLTRFFAGSNSRKSFHKLFFYYSGESELLPALVEEIKSPLKEVLESVRLAPSASNKQPWRIIIQDNLYHLFWNYDKRYNSMIRGFDIQALDMGIALCHFTRAAEELRLDGKFSYSDPHFENVDWKYVLSWKVKA